MTAHGYVLGIDLGTTTSCVAVVRGGRAEVLPDGDGNRILPSVVAFCADGELVGHQAKQQLVSEPENTIYSFKRLIGRRFDDSRVRSAIAGFPYRILEGPNRAVVIEVRGQRYGIPEIAARVLGHLKRLAAQAVGEEVTRAVIAVPATFNDAQRAATRIAGRIAGLDVIRLINEPTAAALAFGYDRRESKTICVYDFGGGTFDVTVLELEGQLVRVMAAAGDAFLGGDDLDLALAFAAAEAFRVETGRYLWRDVAEWQRLLFACEEAKRKLSATPRAEVRVRAVARTSGGVKDLVFPLDRSRFQQICGDKIAQSFQLCSRALSDAGLEPSRVDAVVLVGGTTYVRLVRSGVTSFFGRRPDVTVDPVEAVALGSAIQGAALAGIPVVEPGPPVLLEVTPHALAVSTAGAFHVLIARNEPVPAVEQRTFTTTQDDQTEIRLRVFQGEAPDRQSWPCLGEVVIDGLKPAPAGRVAVDVTFRVDEENRVSVSAVERETGKEVNCHLGADQASGTEPSSELDQLLRRYLAR